MFLKNKKEQQELESEIIEEKQRLQKLEFMNFKEKLKKISSSKEHWLLKQEVIENEKSKILKANSMPSLSVIIKGNGE